jgi:hypothetical protein
MKKTYQIPETVTMKIATSMLLITSDPQVGLDKDAAPVDAGEVDARRSNNAWDEEYEEDF